MRRVKANRRLTFPAALGASLAFCFNIHGRIVLSKHAALFCIVWPVPAALWKLPR
jgi:hypothetical protein